MIIRVLRTKLSSFQMIIIGFLAVIMIGTLLLALPISAKAYQWTSLENAFFTATSAVCVTGLVVRDTAAYWSVFGQIVILTLIQIGGLGIVSVTAFIATVSGKRISLLQRNMLQESISALQVGGVVKMTSFIFKVAFAVELLGAAVMLPTFCTKFGVACLDGEELKLTSMEYKLLCLLAKNTGKVLTHTYITQNIWGRSWDNDIASLRVFMTTLRKKIESGPEAPKYIQTHIGIGYRMLKVD